MKSRERQATHGPKRVSFFAVVVDELMEFTADIRERSGIFGNGARSRSHINFIVVAFGEEEQTIAKTN